MSGTPEERAMFKKVTYTGFEKQPALLTKVQGLVPILDAELDTRLGPIEIEWRYRYPTRVELSIFDEAIGEAEVGGFDPAEVDRSPRFFPVFIWDLYLGAVRKYRRRQILGMKRNWPEPVGA